MLKVQIIYQGRERALPIAESLDAGTVELTARRILREYKEAEKRCRDAVLVTMLRAESAKVHAALAAAGQPQGAKHDQ